MNWGILAAERLAGVASAVGTFAIRYSFIRLLAGKTRRELCCGRWLQSQRFAALVLPLILLNGGAFDLHARWPHRGGGHPATGIYAWWRGGMLVPLIVGMGQAARDFVAGGLAAFAESRIRAGLITVNDALSTLVESCIEPSADAI